MFVQPNALALSSSSCPSASLVSRRLRPGREKRESADSNEHRVASCVVVGEKKNKGAEKNKKKKTDELEMKEKTRQEKRVRHRTNVQT